MESTEHYNSAVGYLRIRANEQAVIAVEFADEPTQDNPSPLTTQCVRELTEYFSGTRKQFSVPLAPDGTEFQQQVWKELLAIPFGTSTTYLALATKLGDRNKLRAVGGANHVNPIAIIIPCHRVVGADRTLVGYGGGLWRKRWLLEHEQTIKEGTKVVTLQEFL